jgi:tetratricopeptide (TPR) repeat protein
MDEFFSLENLEKFCERHPDSLAFAHLAAQHLELNQYEKALQICEKGLKSHPRYAFGHFILGLANYYLKNLTKSKDELEIALSYDSANPLAWKILSSIHEALNQPSQSRESKLKYYLSDYLNPEAAEMYLKSNNIPFISSRENVFKEKVEEKETEFEEAASEEEISRLFTEEKSNNDEFEKALDEVFQDTATEQGEEVLESETQHNEVEHLTESVELKQKKESNQSEDEFTEAMDSFFRDYEEESKGEPLEETETELEEEENKYRSIEEQEETDSSGFIESESEKDKKVEFEIEDREEEIEKQLESETFEDDDRLASELQDVLEEEEPMDFSAVVADIISERDNGTESPGIDEQPPESSELPEAEKTNITEEEIPISKEKGKKELKETELSQAKVEIDESDFDLPVEEIKDSKVKTGKPFADDEKKQTIASKSVKSETTHFGRPPILSPTLGEIYISQGRFEEAIDVFRQLLDKDPENSRYERKIHDLETVIKKQKSE